MKVVVIVLLSIAVGNCQVYVRKCDHSCPDDVIGFIDKEDVEKLQSGKVTFFERTIQIEDSKPKKLKIRQRIAELENQVQQLLEILEEAGIITAATTTEEPTTTTTEATTTTTTELTTTTPSPPPECHEGDAGIRWDKRKRIADYRITASSVYRDWEMFQARHGRLDKPYVVFVSGGWHHGLTLGNQDQWIQVFLGRTPRKVLGVTTQSNGKFSWVTRYRVAHQTFDSRLQFIQQNGEDKIFNGNFDNKTHHTNYFATPFLAHYVRIYPWAYENTPAMRFEVKICLTFCCESGDVGVRSDMMTIKDSQLSASSVHENLPRYQPQRARKGNPYDYRKPPYGWLQEKPWIRKDNSTDNWIMVDLEEVIPINGITIRGDINDGWVTTLRLAYSTDNTTFTFVEKNNSTILIGASIHFGRPVPDVRFGNKDARYIRVYPYDFIGKPVMKFELRKCVNRC